jgi:hypothetical protein
MGPTFRKGTRLSPAARATSPSAATPTSTSGRGALRGLSPFLSRHPVLCLLLLTPGIPEYLSSSSPLYALVLNPPQFVFQLVANLGLYGPGVLLIREAMIRWNKGWGSVLLLGGAYGILEEGVALSTLFDPKAAPVGTLGLYGHWAGVNWLWSATIVPIHMIYSISMPILLLGLALPSTRGRSLLSRRGTAWAATILVADVASLSFLVPAAEHFWMGDAVFVLSLVAIGLLVCLARVVPSGLRLAAAPSPRARPRRLLLVGMVYYPVVLLVTGFGNALHVPALADLLLVGLVQAGFLVYVVRVTGSQGNERQLIALSFGLVLPIAAIGLIGTLGVPVVLLGDLVMALFFRMLWNRYRTVPAGAPVRGPSADGKGLSRIPDASVS